MFGSVRPLIPQICLQSPKNLFGFFPGKQRVPVDKKQKLRETSETIFFCDWDPRKSRSFTVGSHPVDCGTGSAAAARSTRPTSPVKGKEREDAESEKERATQARLGHFFFFEGRTQQKKVERHGREGHGGGGGGAGGLNARGRQVSSWDLAPKRNVP